MPVLSFDNVFPDWFILHQNGPGMQAVEGFLEPGKEFEPQIAGHRDPEFICR